MLLALAVGIVLVAIITPNLKVLEDMTPEEEEATQITPLKAFGLFCTASTFLVVLYIFIDYMAKIMTVVLCFSASVCIALLFTEIMLNAISNKNHFLIKEFKVPCLGEMNFAYVIGLFFGFSLSALWFVTRNWLLCNILAIQFAFVFLKTVRINNLKVGILLLSLLFIYDIFMVFVTPMLTPKGDSVMVTVAQNLDVPILLRMPKFGDTPTQACSLLGLGDIVIPGIYILFVTRFGKEVA